MVERSGTAVRRVRRPAQRLRRAGLLGALAGLLLALGSGCCLVRPPGAETLFEAGRSGFRTPEATFESFRVALGADLPKLEYLCLSQGLRRREGLSYQNYRVFREKLLDEHPLIALLANAEVVESERVDGRRHRLVVQTAGRRLALDLVREDRFQIYAGADFLADGDLDFGRAVEVEPAGAGRAVTARVVLGEEDLAGADLDALTELELSRDWKIDRFADLQEP